MESEAGGNAVWASKRTYPFGQVLPLIVVVYARVVPPLRRFVPGVGIEGISKIMEREAGCPRCTKVFIRKLSIYQIRYLSNE